MNEKKCKQCIYFSLLKPLRIINGHSCIINRDIIIFDFECGECPFFKTHGTECSKQENDYYINIRKELYKLRKLRHDEIKNQ